MSEIDFKSMTDVEIFDLEILINEEKKRRKRESKMPVYCVDGKAMKSLPNALTALKKETDRAINFPGGPEKYFGEAINSQQKSLLLTLEVEFWSKSEYDARPDVVWGC